MSRTEAVLLFDEGPGVGLGHRRRAEALAAELHAAGWSCRLVPMAGASRVNAPIVIVDSYIARADEMEIDAGLLVAIDDLGRDLDVDVLVDPSPGADADQHARATLVLAGAHYALVAHPSAAPTVVAAAAPVTRVLITTGAADTTGTGARAAAAIHALELEFEVRLVVGPWGAVIEPDGVTVVHAPASLTEEMAAASIVVTAGGVSLLEACMLGRAVVALTMADNQRVAVDALAALGAVVAVTEDSVAGTVAELASDTARRRALAAAARRAVDGRGAERVVAHLVEQSEIVRSA